MQFRFHPQDSWGCCLVQPTYSTCCIILHFCIQENASLEYDLQRLAEFKAEFENLADISINDSESNGLNGDSGTAGGAADCGDGGKWKQRAKKLQQYVKWQLAEAETQVCDTRACFGHSFHVCTLARILLSGVRSTYESVISRRGKGGSMHARKLRGGIYGLCGFALAFLPRSVSNHPIQAQRDRAQMALRSRSHEILMAEMAVLVKRYRRERSRLYEVNRTLLQQLAEHDAQVRVCCGRSTVLGSHYVRVYSRFYVR